MEIDYPRLRNIYRLERQSQTRLTALEPDFYRRLGQYVQDEKEKVVSAREQQEIDRLIYFANLLKLVGDFVAIRQRKIVHLALASAFDDAWEPEHLVDWEKELYSEVVATIRRYRDDALASVGLKEETHEENTLNHIRVKVLQYIPKFVGTDCKTYGPYSGGEIVELPPEIADILLARNFAEVVEDEKDSDAQI